MSQQRVEKTLREISKNLRLADSRLREKDSRARIEIIGVAHDWSPGQKLLKKLSNADIVTLELTRNVVSDGLNGNNGQLLGRNRFWRQVINTLRVSDNPQIVRGIEVNQTTRIAWKRHLLHEGSRGIKPANIIIECENSGLPNLEGLLSKAQIEEIQKRKWLITQDSEIRDRLVLAAIERMDATNESLALPIELRPGIGIRQFINDVELRDSSCFMMVPDESLIDAEMLMQKRFVESSISEDDSYGLAQIGMMNLMMSLVELTDAREISYFLNQYSRLKDDTSPNVLLCHVGGAAHSQTISKVLKDCLPDNSNIQVKERSDPRFGSYHRSISAVMTDMIPFHQLASCVNAFGYDVRIDCEALDAVLKQYIPQMLPEVKRRLDNAKLWQIVRPNDRDTQQNHRLMLRHYRS